MKKFYLYLFIALASLRLCAAEIEQKEIKPSKKINTLIKNAQFFFGSTFTCITIASIFAIPALISSINYAHNRAAADDHFNYHDEVTRHILGLAVAPIIAWFSAQGARYFLKKSLQEDDIEQQNSTIAIKEDDEL